MAGANNVLDVGRKFNGNVDRILEKKPLSECKTTGIRQIELPNELEKKTALYHLEMATLL